MKLALILTVAAIGILVVSLLPWEAKKALGTYTVAHRYLHFGAFAVVSGLAFHMAHSRKARLAAAAALLLLALASEVGEYIVYNENDVEWPDLADDAAGIVVAFAIGGLVRRRGGSANRAAS